MSKGWAATVAAIGTSYWVGLVYALGLAPPDPASKLTAGVGFSVLWLALGAIALLVWAELDDLLETWRESRR